MNIGESKTLVFWLMLLALAFAVIIFTTVAQHFGWQVPYVNDFLNLIGLGGGVGTARNVAADHAIPAWQATQMTPAQTKAVAAVETPAVLPDLSGGFKLPF
jgi:hypothetical protein